MRKQIQALLTGVAVAAIGAGLSDSARADQIIYWTNF
jgi:hypothetical protein